MHMLQCSLLRRSFHVYDISVQISLLDQSRFPNWLGPCMGDDRAVPWVLSMTPCTTFRTDGLDFVRKS